MFASAAPPTGSETTPTGSETSPSTGIEAPATSIEALSVIDSPSSSIPIDPAILEPIPTIVLTAAEESILSAAQKARDDMANRYTKRFVIETFAPDTIVTVRVPKEDRGTLDHARLYARVINQPHRGRYKLQTEHGILDRLYPTRELNRVDNPTLAGMSPTGISILSSINLIISATSSSKFGSL